MMILNVVHNGSIVVGVLAYNANEYPIPDFILGSTRFMDYYDRLVDEGYDIETRFVYMYNNMVYERVFFVKDISNGT